MKVKEEPKSAEKSTPVHSFFGECAGTHSHLVSFSPIKYIYMLL